MKLTDAEIMLIRFFRAADMEKRSEAFRILNGNTIICLSVAELRQHYDSLRNEAREKTGE